MKSNIIFSLLLSFSGLAQAQIPTIDAANLARQIQQVKNWEVQLRAMSDAYNQQVAQFKSLTGNRGFGNLLNDPSMRQYLPAEWQQVYQNLNGQGLSGLTPGAQAIRQQFGIGQNCVAITNPNDRKLCETRAGQNAQDYDVFNVALQSATQRTKMINELQNQINQADDPKGIAELQARIQAESANLQNEMTKMQLSIKLAEIQNKLMQQRGDEELRARFAR